MIYTVTLNPALDKTVEIPSLTLDSVNRITSMRTDPGGKGINVSKVIKKLGGTSIATGILAGETGRTIESTLTTYGLQSFFHYVEGETRTNLKIIDPVCHTNTDLNEPGVVVSKQILSNLLSDLSERIHQGDIVVLSGSVPKGAPVDTYAQWTKVCQDLGSKVILDADGELFKEGIKASPYLIKPNHHELSAFVGQPLHKPEEIEQAARQLMKEYQISKVVVSMGSDGALYLTEEETMYAEGLKVPVGSTVGAGDSVVAALAISEENNMDLTETVRLSTATGAANVMCSGTQAAEYDTIRELIPKVIIHKLPLKNK